MRIGVNARRLEGQRLGVGRYIEALLRHWDRRLRAEDSLKVFVRTPFDKEDLGLSNRVEVCQLEPGLTGAVWENVVLPWQAAGIEVLFCPSYTAPIRYGAAPLVVATHSVNESDPGSSNWKDQYVYGPWYRRSARQATEVVVPAEITAQDVQKYYGVPPDRIHVVPQGADDSFKPLHDESLIRETRRKYLGADVPYVLFVGKLSTRRNIPMLLRAFARFKRETALPHKLLLVGPNHHQLPLTELIAGLDLRDTVVQTDGRFTHHTQIVPIYNGADVFIQPSLYEGFSITTVEAFACGVPVIAANRGGLGEIASGAARMVDDPSEEGLACALAEVLRDPVLRARLREASIERAKLFRWEHTARETWQVLERAVARRKAETAGSTAKVKRAYP